MAPDLFSLINFAVLFMSLVARGFVDYDLLLVNQIVFYLQEGFVAVLLHAGLEVPVAPILAVQVHQVSFFFFFINKFLFLDTKGAVLDHSLGLDLGVAGLPLFFASQFGQKLSNESLNVLGAFGQLVGKADPRIVGGA